MCLHFARPSIHVYRDNCVAFSGLETDDLLIMVKFIHIVIGLDCRIVIS